MRGARLDAQGVKTILNLPFRIQECIKWTPLQFMCAEGNVDAVTLLLRFRADHGRCLHVSLMPCGSHGRLEHIMCAPGRLEVATQVAVAMSDGHLSPCDCDRAMAWTPARSSHTNTHRLRTRTRGDGRQVHGITRGSSLRVCRRDQRAIGGRCWGRCSG